MVDFKRIFDVRGYCLLEMFIGIGKIIILLLLIMSYMLVNLLVGKFIYCI